MSLVAKPPNRGGVDPVMHAWFTNVRDYLTNNAVILLRNEASADTELDFALDTVKDYLHYQIKLVNITVSAASLLYLRVSDDEGVTYESGASAYQWGVHSAVYDGTPAVTLLDDLADSEIELMEVQASNTANNLVNGTIDIYNPGNASTYTMVSWNLTYNNAAGQLVSAQGAGSYLAASIINRIRIYPSSGNVVSGISELIGYN